MPAPPLANNYEGGTNGTAVSAANSGGASGNAFTSVDGTLADYHAAIARGSLSVRIAQTATPASSRMYWASLGNIAGSNVYFRAYLYVPANPATNLNWFEWRTSTPTRSAAVFIRTGGTLRITDDALASLVETTSTIALNQWIRVEFRILPSTTAGEVELRLYNDPDSTTATDTKVATGLTTLAATVDALRFGHTSAPANFVNYFDEVAVSTSGWIGPTAGAAAQKGRPDADLAAGGWTPTPSSPSTLYDKIDESAADDADYIEATAS